MSIVTKGLGSKSYITQGYGKGFINDVINEIVSIYSNILKNIFVKKDGNPFAVQLYSRIKQNDSLNSYIKTGIKLKSNVF